MNLNAQLSDYLREIVCKCPKCGQRAAICAESNMAWPWHPKRVSFTCPCCVLQHGWPVAGWTSDFTNFKPAKGREPYFGYQIWAMTVVGKNNLALLNREHAADLEAFIGEIDRPRPQNTKWSMLNRLPKWMLLKKNRHRVLGAINKLKISLP